MTEAPATIEVDPESELARILAEAAATSAVLISNGARYRVSREDEDLWVNYDPERVREALRTAAGTLTPEEGERLKELNYRGREEGTRPLDRP